MSCILLFNSLLVYTGMFMLQFLNVIFPKQP